MCIYPVQFCFDEFIICGEYLLIICLNYKWLYVIRVSHNILSGGGGVGWGASQYRYVFLLA